MGWAQRAMRQQDQVLTLEECLRRVAFELLRMADDARGQTPSNAFSQQSKGKSLLLRQREEFTMAK